jgi:hypothetical protein
VTFPGTLGGYNYPKEDPRGTDLKEPLREWGAGLPRLPSIYGASHARRVFGTLLGRTQGARICSGRVIQEVLDCAKNAYAGATQAS